MGFRKLQALLFCVLAGHGLQRTTALFQWRVHRRNGIDRDTQVGRVVNPALHRERTLRVVAHQDGIR